MQQHQHIGRVDPHMDLAPDLLDGFFHRGDGGEGQHEQDKKRECPSENEPIKCKSFDDRGYIQPVDQHHEYQHVRKSPVEGIQSERLTQRDDDRPAGDGAQRRDSQRRE